MYLPGQAVDSVMNGEGVSAYSTFRGSPNVAPALSTRFVGAFNQVFNGFYVTT